MKIKKLNQKGFAHWIMPAIVIVIIAAIGTYVLTASHADTPKQWSGWQLVTTPHGPIPTTQTPAASAVPGTNTINLAFNIANSGNNIGWTSSNQGSNWTNVHSITPDSALVWPAALSRSSGTTLLYASPPYGSFSAAQKLILNSNGSAGSAWQNDNNTAAISQGTGPALTNLNSGSYAEYFIPASNQNNNPTNIYQIICVSFYSCAPEQSITLGANQSGSNGYYASDLKGIAAATTADGITHVFVTVNATTVNNSVMGVIAEQSSTSAVSSSTTSNWSGTGIVNGRSIVSPSAPAAVAVGNSIYLFIRGSDGHNYEAIHTPGSNGGTWSSWQLLGGNDLAVSQTRDYWGNSTPQEPGISATVYGTGATGDDIALYTVGTDGNIYQDLLR